MYTTRQTAGRKLKAHGPETQLRVARGRAERYAGLWARWLAQGSSASWGSLEKAFPWGPARLAASRKHLGKPAGAGDQHLLPPCLRPAVLLDQAPRAKAPGHLVPPKVWH